MTAPHPLGPLAPLAAYRQFIVAERANKIPFSAATGNPHSAHDPAAWLAFEDAARIVATWGPEHFGIGFVLTEADPFVVVDIDNCRTPSGWSDLANEVCTALPGAVVELSQSGQGLHVWARASRLPAHAKRAPGLECYSSARYIMLGSQASGMLAEDCPAMRDFAARRFPPQGAGAAAAQAEGPSPEWNGPEDDAALLELAMRARSAASVFGDGVTFAQLWAADADALGRKWPAGGRPYDASSADAALAQHLAFWTGRDVARIERLMRRSALIRDKWDRPDYLPRTIDAACAQQREVYRSGKQGGPAPAPGAAPAIEASDGVPSLRYGLVPDDPLNAARALVQRRYTHADGPCLKAWQGAFFRWGGACWHELSADDSRALAYDFLDVEGESHYRPNQSKVSNLLDALRAAVHLDSRVLAPAWIKGAALAPAGEIVACGNGLLQLSSGQLLPATPRFFNLNAVPFNYKANGPAPAAWLRFLAGVWPNDAEAINTLQELFGYLLTPDTSQQKIFLIVGPKRSGKGTIARVLTAMLGTENVAGPSLASLGSEFGLQPLIGKQAAIVSDARLGGHADAARVAENLLRISGEDCLDVNRKNKTILTMRLATRFVLLTNELPRIVDASGAMASRFVILTMSESFLGREDPGLTGRLLAELPGVLRWAVAGWHRLKARGHFVEPKSSASAVQELADLGSPISAFVRDECTCAPTAEIETGELFNVWCTWCARQGMQHTGTVQTFGRDLRAAFPSITQAQPRSGGGRIRVYRGITARGTQRNANHPIVGFTAPIPL